MRAFLVLLLLRVCLGAIYQFCLSKHSFSPAGRATYGSASYIVLANYYTGKNISIHVSEYPAHCISSSEQVFTGPQFVPPDPPIYIDYGQANPDSYFNESSILSLSYSGFGCGFLYQAPPLKIAPGMQLGQMCASSGKILSLSLSAYGFQDSCYIFSRFYAPSSMALGGTGNMFYNVFTPGSNHSLSRDCVSYNESPFVGYIYFKCSFPLPPTIRNYTGIVGVDQADIYSHNLIADPAKVVTANEYIYCYDVVDDLADSGYVIECLTLKFSYYPRFVKTPLSGIATVILPDSSPSYTNPLFCPDVYQGNCTGFGGRVRFFEPGTCLDCIKSYAARSTINYVIGDYNNDYDSCVKDPIRLSGYRYEVCWPDFAYELRSQKKLRFFDCRSMDAYRMDCSVARDFSGYRIVCDAFKCPPSLMKPFVGYSTIKLYLTEADGMYPSFYSVYRASFYKTRGATVFLTDYGPGLVIVLLLLTTWVMMLICFVVAILYSFLEICLIKYPDNKFRPKAIYLCGTLAFGMFISLSYMSYGAYKTLVRMDVSEVLQRSNIQWNNFKSRWIAFSFLGFFLFPIYFFVMFFVGIFLVSKVFSKRVATTKAKPVKAKRRSTKKVAGLVEHYHY